MKRYVYEQLNRIWPGSAQIEWPRGWGIADVWIRLPDGHGVAVECQVTHLDSNRITAKILNYAVSGDAVLFVVPWRCLTEYDDGSYKVPLWLRWLHGSYMGRLYLFGLEGVQVVNFLDDQWSKTFRSLRPGPMIDWKQLSWQWAGDRGPLGHLKFRIAHFQEGVFWRR
jgi:hypothetical protein